MLGGAHIKSLINAKLANPNNVNTLTRVVNEIQANLTRRFTRERVLRNMLDAHFIIDNNKKNRLASDLIYKMTGQTVSRNSIKKFLNETNHNVVLTANGKYRVTEKSQGQRLGELNRYVFNGGNVRNAFLKNLNSSGTQLKNANFYLSQSSKYNVKNLNGGKKFVKFKNVPAPAPTVSKKNVNNSKKRLVHQVRLVVKRSVTTLKSAREMKKLRNNLEALKSGGQAALARVQANLAAAKKNAANAKSAAQKIQTNRNASNAEKAAAAKKAAEEAAQYREVLAAATAASAATKEELTAAQGALNAARANANRQRQDHEASLKGATEAAEQAVRRVQEQLNAALRNKTANATQIRELSEKLNSVRVNATEAQRKLRDTLHEAMANAQAERNIIQAKHRAALQSKNTELASKLKEQEKAAITAHEQLLKQVQNNHAAELAQVQLKLANHQVSLSTVRAGLLAAEKNRNAARNASAAEKNEAARKLAAAQAAVNAVKANAAANKNRALTAQRDAHQNVLNAEIAAKNAAERARRASVAERNAAQAEAAAARAALGKARALEAAAVNVAGKAANAAKAAIGAGLGVTKFVAKGALAGFGAIGKGFGEVTRLAPANVPAPAVTAPVVRTRGVGQSASTAPRPAFGTSASTGRTTNRRTPSRYKLSGLIKTLERIQANNTLSNNVKRTRYQGYLNIVNGSSNLNKNIKKGTIQQFIRRLNNNSYRGVIGSQVLPP
jgi:hypothetical protein